jgi:hypothetical protein
VVAAEIDDVPGSLAALLFLLKGTQVNINYMYALAGTGGTSSKAVMVFRFSDNDRAIRILQSNNIKLLDARDFGMIDAAK